MNIKEQIEKDYIEAYKERNELKTSVLRMIKSALKNEEINKKSQLEDEDTIRILKKELKQRKDLVEEYRKANREDAAQKEQAEILIIEPYLPEQLSEEEVRKIVAEVLESQNISDLSQSGKVIGQIMGQYKGKVDGGIVSKTVKELLQNK